MESMDIELQEKQRKTHLIRLYARIGLGLQAMVWAITIFTSIRAGVVPNVLNITFSVGFIFAGLCISSYVLAGRKRNRLASWLLISGGLVEIYIIYFRSGADLPLGMALMIFIAMSIVLLRAWESLVVTGIVLAQIVSIYLFQYVFNIITISSSALSDMRVANHLIIYLASIPVIVALLNIPITGRMRTLLEHNRQLKTALEEINSRQKATEKASEQVLYQAAELKITAGQQASSSQEQAAVVTQVYNSVGELLASASHIQELAQQVNLVTIQVATENSRIEATTARSVKNADKGLLAVERTLAENKEVSLLYQELQSKSIELKDLSLSTRTILEVLSSISHETHLLSLNAAIEAAGAGDYGERFAVVAREVKQLATRSAKASQEAGKIVSEIEHVSAGVAEAVEEGYQKARSSEIIAGESGQVIEELRQVVEETQEQVVSISKAVKEVTQLSEIIKAATVQQRSGSQQIQEALQNLGVVANQTAENSQMIARSATNLEAVSERLNQTLSV